MKKPPITHEILKAVPLSPAYHSDCLLWSGGKWEEVKEIHPMSDLHISFAKQGLLAFMK
jgi:hypothetical protein